MDFADLIQYRYSVRSYLSKAVEEDKLHLVLEAARLAPTAANVQAFRLIVARTEGRETELKRIYPADWFVAAPLIICICGIPAKNWKRNDGKNYSDVDVAIVMDHLILQATDLGLGTCWIGAFDAAATREVFDLPDEAAPIALTPLGYAADKPRSKNRKPLEKLLSYERW